jgi:hypothetical protein
VSSGLLLLTQKSEGFTGKPLNKNRRKRDGEDHSAHTLVHECFSSPLLPTGEIRMSTSNSLYDFYMVLGMITADEPRIIRELFILYGIGRDQ